MKELHQAERCAPAYKDTKILFPVKTFAKKALDTKRACRIMPFDTRYPIPDTRYPIPDTRYPIPDTGIKARCTAACFYASSFVGAAGETRGNTAFIIHSPEDAYLFLKARRKRRGSVRSALPRDEFAVPQTRRAYSFLTHIPENVYLSLKTSLFQNRTSCPVLNSRFTAVPAGKVEVVVKTKF